MMSSTGVSKDGWRLITRGFDCGFGINGGVDIIATNTHSTKTIVVAVGDDVSETTIKSPVENHFVVNLPNLSDIHIEPVAMPDLTVGFNFLPHYNPDERDHYQVWRKDPANDANRQWYCTTIMPTVDQANKAMLDENLAYTYLKPRGSKKSYCK